jgi:hypothetical protein
MKNIKFLMLLCAACAFFTSCDKTENSAEPSKITYLPKITVLGEPDIELPCSGGSYTDEGATATESGAAITLNTVINPSYFGSSEINGPDKYIISYSAENKDGIPGAASRKVVWPVCNGDLVTSIAGTYTAYLSRLNVGTGATLATPQYQGVGPVYIKDLGNDEYQLSDALGGWYEYGRSLGTGFLATGQTITANNILTNDFTFGPPVEVGTFGGLNTMTGMTVDAATKTIVWTTSWEAGFEFTVTLVQND